jgi:8-oxo-dGTP diphosphatase
MTKPGKHTYRFPRPMVTVDAVVFRHTRERLEVLVVDRGIPPFKGMTAFPGGFVEMDEDLLDAIKRELFEETGLGNVQLEQLRAFGRPGRDPRGRNISIAFAGVVKGSAHAVRAGDDASRAYWIPARRPGPMAFDHNEILRAALRWLKDREKS